MLKSQNIILDKGYKVFKIIKQMKMLTSPEVIIQDIRPQFIILWKIHKIQHLES